MEWRVYRLFPSCCRAEGKYLVDQSPVFGYIRWLDQVGLRASASLLPTVPLRHKPTLCDLPGHRITYYIMIVTVETTRGRCSGLLYWTSVKYFILFEILCVVTIFHLLPVSFRLQFGCIAWQFYRLNMIILVDLIWDITLFNRMRFLTL